MSIDMRLALAAFGFLVAASLIAFIAVRSWRNYQLHRERQKRDALIKSIAIDFVRNQLVDDGNGGALHIDWLLLTSRGLLLLDVRDVHGNLFGSDQMADWTVMKGAKRSTFPNPLGPLYDRLAVLRRLVPEWQVEGRVAFTASAQFPKGMPTLCLKVVNLASEFPAATGSAATALASMLPAWERVRKHLTPSPAALSRM